MNLNIFKSYDIRGVYPKELDEDTAFKIGQAFANYVKAKKIVVGRDMRLSSKVLFDSLIKGIISQGADVYDIGLVATECVYFSIVNYKYDAGIMVTASHNPKEYNGFKMIKRNGKNVRFVRGKDLIDIVSKDFINRKKGRTIKLNIWKDYIKHLSSFLKKDIKPLKIIVDAGNGMAGKIIPLISLPIKVIPLNFKLDGNFPSRPSNVLEKGATDEISQEIKKRKANFGFLFDGDADRIYLVDENGDFIRADITLLLLAKYFLKKRKESIVYNLICSKAVPEFIKRWGGVSIKSPVGAVNLMELLSDNKAVMGGELSGHYCFKNTFGADSGFVAYLILLQVISDNKLSEMVKELSIYFKGAEINFKVRDKEKAINIIKNKYLDAKKSYLDGVTMEYKDWWFNLRPSNTEPLLRLTIEADNQKLLKQKTKELRSLVSGR
jgi:phosphomannomutase